MASSEHWGSMPATHARSDARFGVSKTQDTYAADLGAEYNLKEGGFAGSSEYCTPTEPSNSASSSGPSLQYFASTDHQQYVQGPALSSQSYHHEAPLSSYLDYEEPNTFDVQLVQPNLESTSRFTSSQPRYSTSATYNDDLSASWQSRPTNNILPAIHSQSHQPSHLRSTVSSNIKEQPVQTFPSLHRESVGRPKHQSHVSFPPYAPHQPIHTYSDYPSFSPYPPESQNVPFIYNNDLASSSQHRLPVPYTYAEPSQHVPQHSHSTSQPRYPNNRLLSDPADDRLTLSQKPFSDTSLAETFGPYTTDPISIPDSHSSIDQRTPHVSVDHPLQLRFPSLPYVRGDNFSEKVPDVPYNTFEMTSSLPSFQPYSGQVTQQSPCLLSLLPHYSDPALTSKMPFAPAPTIMSQAQFSHQPRHTVEANNTSAEIKPVKAKLETRTLEGTCLECATKFGTIYLRGRSGDFLDPYDLVYKCPLCESTRTKLDNEKGDNEYDKTSIGDNTQKPLLKEKEKNVAKKRFRNDATTPASCDVCDRVVAYGAPIARDDKADLSFNIEIVCVRCNSRYARCSDCGGGGGARLGVGKWRCKELFSPGRKTCNLSHSRQPDIATMQYTVTRISDISDSEMPELQRMCQKVFESSLYGTLAVPEILERGTAMATTYEDVVERVNSGWLECKNLISHDVEAEDGYRRYLGLRWAAPKPRKTTRRNSTESSPHVQNIESTDRTIIIPGKILSGYVTAEWDRRAGTMFITVLVPYSTGEQYEGAAHLVSLIQNQAIRERQDTIQDLSTQNRVQEAYSIPPILHSFTLIFFKKDSKLLQYLESKRALLPLDRYLAKYPDADEKAFPPLRKSYLSLERQKGWNCLVRRINAQESVAPIGPTPSSRRSARYGHRSGSGGNQNEARDFPTPLSEA